MGEYVEQMNLALRPVAPPRVLEGVYTDDQYDAPARRRQAATGRGRRSSRTTSTSVDELIATVDRASCPRTTASRSTTSRPPHFRGFFGQNSVCFYPEIDDCFYNDRLPRAGQGLLGRAVRQAHADAVQHLRAPPQPGSPPHLDAVTFRGVRYREHAGVAAELMGKSGLFTDYLVKMAQVITWWYRGENGTFTYWPDGPLGQPQGARAPALEQGRRRAERDDVPPRRPGRRARRARRSRASSTGR